jgi:hypothetical protein
MTTHEGGRLEDHLAGMLLASPEVGPRHGYATMEAPRACGFRALADATRIRSSR